MLHIHKWGPWDNFVKSGTSNGAIVYQQHTCVRCGKVSGRWI